MTKLSVNINKVATLRNARGENIPDVVKFAIACELYGAQGITIHPRPDERHITRKDVFDLKKVVTTEFNIEGYPSPEFIALVKEVHPTQVTLVPDPPGVLTSNAGWDTVANLGFLTDVCGGFNEEGIRTSIFVNADEMAITKAAEAGAKRVELYTKPYADEYAVNREEAVKPFTGAAIAAKENGLGLNAGHDLNLHNLAFFKKMVPGLLEVSIGHAIISDALYMGIGETIRLYLNCLK